MRKYDLLPEQLIHEGTISSENLFSPKLLSENDILTVHHPIYWQKLKTLNLSKVEIRRSGFPVTDDLIIRERIIASGTIEAALYAKEFGVAMNVAGGTHHAYTDRAEGFCLLNDQALASRYLLNHGLARRILIVDLDVHQGNGTAEIFQNEPSVFTFSMHGEKNYPMKKETSDLDVPLPDKTEDAEYLKLLDFHLKSILDMFQPDFMFFQAGVDVLASDKLGRLALTLNGCKSRDQMVLSIAKNKNIPIVVCMGGGYSEDIRIILEAHANTFRLAQELFF